MFRYVKCLLQTAADCQSPPAASFVDLIHMSTRIANDFSSYDVNTQHEFKSSRGCRFTSSEPVLECNTRSTLIQRGLFQSLRLGSGFPFLKSSAVTRRYDGKYVAIPHFDSIVSAISLVDRAEADLETRLFDES